MLEQLMRSARAGRIVHALLFTGPRGFGKRTAARLFTQALFCTGAEKPCGVCPACRQVENGTHPDVHILRPDGRDIKVDQARQLIDDISVMPYEGAMHAVIIERADRMNESAQNALLKTLENPVVPAIFFLLAESAADLLPTVRSRCQQVRFRALSPEECAGVLMSRGISAPRASLLAGVSGGSVGRALEIDADETYFPLRERVVRSLGLLRGPGSVATAASVLTGDKERSEDVLEIMERIARDRLAVENGAAPLAPDAAEILSGVKADGRALLMGVMDVRRQLLGNGTWQNALETMYFRVSTL